MDRIRWAIADFFSSPARIAVAVLLVVVSLVALALFSVFRAASDPGPLPGPVSAASSAPSALSVAPVLVTDPARCAVLMEQIRPIFAKYATALEVSLEVDRGTVAATTSEASGVCSGYPEGEAFLVSELNPWLISLGPGMLLPVLPPAQPSVSPSSS